MLKPGKLAELRQRKGWSQFTLGVKVGVQPAVMSRYETGKHHPSTTMLILLADALGVSPLDILMTPDELRDALAEKELAKEAL